MQYRVISQIQSQERVANKTYPYDSVEGPEKRTKKKKHEKLCNKIDVSKIIKIQDELLSNKKLLED